MKIVVIGNVSRKWKGNKTDGIDVIENFGTIPLVGEPGTFDKIVMPQNEEDPPARVKIEGSVAGSFYEGKLSLKIRNAKIEQAKA